MGSNSAASDEPPPAEPAGGPAAADRPASRSRGCVDRDQAQQRDDAGEGRRGADVYVDERRLKNTASSHDVRTSQGSRVLRSKQR
jgi:hypothetical protein